LQETYEAQGNKIMAKKVKPQTGGLQEKKIKVEPTVEEIKQVRKEQREKRREKIKERKKDKPSLWARLRDVFAELKKVNWPAFGHAVKQTGVVLGVVLTFSLVVFGIDRGLGELFKLLTGGLV